VSKMRPLSSRPASERKPASPDLFKTPSLLPMSLTTPHRALSIPLSLDVSDDTPSGLSSGNDEEFENDKDSGSEYSPSLSLPLSIRCR